MNHFNTTHASSVITHTNNNTENDDVKVIIYAAQITYNFSPFILSKYKKKNIYKFERKW